MSAPIESGFDDPTHENHRWKCGFCGIPLGQCTCFIEDKSAPAAPPLMQAPTTSEAGEGGGGGDQQTGQTPMDWVNQRLFAISHVGVYEALSAQCAYNLAEWCAEAQRQVVKERARADRAEASLASSERARMSLNEACDSLQREIRALRGGGDQQTGQTCPACEQSDGECMAHGLLKDATPAGVFEDRQTAREWVKERLYTPDGRNRVLDLDDAEQLADRADRAEAHKRALRVAVERLYSERDALRLEIGAWRATVEARTAERDVAYSKLREIADVAHDGGLKGMSQHEALAAIRAFSLPFWTRAALNHSTHHTPTYLDRPNAPGWWWRWDARREEYFPYRIREDMLDSSWGKWVPATPPPPPAKENGNAI